MTRANFRSQFEYSVAQQILNKGTTFEYETYEYQYWIKTRGECACCGSRDIWEEHWYNPDFLLPNGIWLEAKGKWTPKDREKHKAMQRDHPDVDVRFVFMRNNKIHKNSNTRYSDYCDKHGMKWCVGSIPREWLQ